MPRTKLQAEVDSWKPKYPDFNSFPNIISSTVLSQSYLDISESTALRMIKKLPGAVKIGGRTKISKRKLGQYLGEID